MQNEETYSKKLLEIKTVAEAVNFKNEIDALITGLYKIDNKTQLSETFLRNLKIQVSKLKTLRLTLCFEPAEGFLKQISAWVKQNIGPDVVLDLSLDPSLIAGAVVEWQGKHLDLSLADLLASKYEI